MLQEIRAVIFNHVVVSVQSYAWISRQRTESTNVLAQHKYGYVGKTSTVFVCMYGGERTCTRVDVLYLCVYVCAVLLCGLLCPRRHLNRADG